ncbi:MAG: rhamnulose-1-phosphate aldolase [Sphaerochaetaceae bacterium]
MDSKAYREFIKICTDGFVQGWHERNGGNLSYRMTEEDIAETEPFFKRESSSHPLENAIPVLSGATFMVTGSGRFMRNVSLEPEKNFGIIRLDDTGSSYSVLWGLEDSRPTSELPTHLMNHAARMSVTNGKCRVIYHAHPANITALTYTIEPNAKTLSRILWQSETECAVVFPEGIGIVPWMVPGGTEIAKATSVLIKEYPAVVWAFHGVFCSGSTFDEAFGLMHTIEKAAEIYLKAKSIGIINTISDDNLRVLAKAFSVHINEAFLD